MQSRASIAVVVGVACSVALAAQRDPPTTGPTFEVGSIKRTVPAERQSKGFLPGATRFTAIDVPASALIGVAYRDDMDGMRGAPEWSLKEHYDVVAPVPPGTSPAQRALMLRNLLVERFHLVVHFESEERNVLALVRTQPDGPVPSGLRAVDVDCDALAGRGAPPARLPSSMNAEMPPCQAVDGGRLITSGGMPLTYLANRVSLTLDRNVVDDTGLKGPYAFTLKYMPRMPGFPEPTDEYPELATALRDQLGLKLVPKKAAVRILVVDRFERPTED